MYQSPHNYFIDREETESDGALGPGRVLGPLPISSKLLVISAENFITKLQKTRRFPKN